MNRIIASLLLCAAGLSHAEVPANLIVEGVPDIPPAVAEDAGRYLEFRTAVFSGWHPQRREMLISTRFAETAQLHLVGMPDGARRQMTFLPEPVRGGEFRPGRGDCVLFSRDAGGGEFYQLYKLNMADGRVTLLTDGKSRNTGATWSHDGSLVAFNSTRRNGKDSDFYVMNPDDPATARLVAEVEGGGWGVSDWSPDGKQWLVTEYISANVSHVWIFDAASGNRERLTPADGPPVARGGATFSKDGQAVFLTSDEGGEFQQLGRMNLAERKFTALTADLRGDVESFALSPDGKIIAYVANEAGSSILRYLAAVEGAELPPQPVLPAGVIGGLEWHADGQALGFTLTSARSPADAWSLEVTAGKLTRWTSSETGGLDTASLVEPEIVRVKSFDGQEVSGFLYRPDPVKHPGPRPVVVMIHGGPEGQSRPVFLSRNNYFLNELGVALLYPNVRGSDGSGKSFLALDNGFKRKDSVKDIAAFLDVIADDAALDAGRTAVMGGSYGGYMVLACMIDYADRLRCGVDIVGISNFVTFLKNTQDYRRDLRRVEYGDEREPAMAEFLQRISPAANASAIRKPLFVVQGKNDPRVPVTEAEQMVQAVRAAGGDVWYLMAEDEGHGFAKKANADYQFMATILFLRKYLLEQP